MYDRHQKAFVIERIEQKNGLFHFYGNNKELSEAELGENKVTYSLLDRFSLGQIDPPSVFALRRESLHIDYQRRISEVKGFLGGRIDLIPHQLYIAHEVSTRYAPRVLLSDQVGLGKTIEACLIMHRLLLGGQISRVLIVVPEPLVHQWFVEVWRRFNLWFHIYDEERCAALADSAPDGNPFLDDQLIICSTALLAESQKRAQQAIDAGWDMLVVDEAHHLAWSVDHISKEYTLVEQLAKVAQGVLLLTATPEQLGLESHFARLRLLDPDRYSNFEAFQQEAALHQKTAKVAEKVQSHQPLSQAEKKLLAPFFPAKRLNEVNESNRAELIEELLDQFGPGRVIFRNNRSAMRGFPKRHAHLYPITAKNQSSTWTDSLVGNDDPENMAQLWQQENDAIGKEQSLMPKSSKTENPKIAWLIDLLKAKPTEKMLLICKAKETVLELEKALSKPLKRKVALFHEELSIVQRDKQAAWFAEAHGARILLCSEMGSEGRNFQFAHHLILFDLPAHPELLEQRIGRLDRIGQTQDIHIHVPYLKDSPQQVLAQWYHQGLNAFEKHIEGGATLFKAFEQALREVSQTHDFKETQKQIQALIKQTQAFQMKLQKKLAAGRDKLLEWNSFRPKVAKKWVREIESVDRDRSLEKYLTKVFEHFKVEMEDLSPRTFFLHPTPGSTLAFPGLPSEGISVTFDRKKALQREDIGFLSWDHPMTTGAIDLVLGSGTGSVSYAELRGKHKPGFLLETLFVLETAGQQRASVDRFMPNTPLRMVVDMQGSPLTERYPADTLQNQLISLPFDELAGQDLLLEHVLPKMIEAATEHVEVLKSEAIEGGLKRMNRRLGYEINRLKQLQKKNPTIRNEEIAVAEREKKNLAQLIRQANLRLDALLLIKTGQF